MMRDRPSVASEACCSPSWSVRRRRGAVIHWFRPTPQRSTKRISRSALLETTAGITNSVSGTRIRTVNPAEEVNADIDPLGAERELRHTSEVDLLRVVLGAHSGRARGVRHLPLPAATES